MRGRTWSAHDLLVYEEGVVHCVVEGLGDFSASHLDPDVPDEKHHSPNSALQQVSWTQMHTDKLKGTQLSS